MLSLISKTLKSRFEDSGGESYSIAKQKFKGRKYDFLVKSKVTVTLKVIVNSSPEGIFDNDPPIARTIHS
jgi:hypothetical protein